MSTEQKRNEFLRIAAEVSLDDNRVFVVAVDGIDHAARAGSNIKTFLSSLPDPEFIPNNVKFLISGQPKENYSNYPMWIYDGCNDDICEIKVPSIQRQDIKGLVYEHFHEQHDNNYIDRLTELIDRYSGGNTLAAIFAVHEALKCQTLTELEQIFINRKLSGNINDYYNSIWAAAINEINIPYIAYRIAGALAFFNEPIDGKILSTIYECEKISISNWSNILKSLRPLLVERDGGFSILHNDVRVFLSLLIGREQDHVREVYSRLADYYIRQENKSFAYYHDTLRFLEYSGRLSDFDIVYCPDFLIAAYVKGIDISELNEVSEKMLSYVIEEKPLNWLKLRRLAVGFKTLDQIGTSEYEIETNCYREKAFRHIHVSNYECYTEKVCNWNYKILEEVFSLVVNLFENQETDRANGLYNRWFSDVSIADIYKCIGDYSEEDDYANPELNHLAKLIAKVTCNTKRWDFVKGLKREGNNDYRFALEISDNIASYAFNNFSGEDLFNALTSLEILSYHSVSNGVMLLVKDGRVKEMSSVEAALRNRVTTDMGSLLLALVRIISISLDPKSDDAKSILEYVENVRIPDGTTDTHITYYCVYCLILSYISPKTRTEIVATVLSEYIKRYPYRNQTYYSVFFNAVCYIGKWLSSRYGGETLKENVRDLEAILKNSFLKDWGYDDFDVEIRELRPLILKAFIWLSRSEAGKSRDVVDGICENLFINNPVGQLLDAGIYYYQDDHDRVTAWYSDWLDSDGRLWELPIGERNRIFTSLIDIKERYGLDYINTSDAYEILAWSVIDYASNKEYSGYQLLDWYKLLSNKNKDNILKYAKTIKDLSDKIEERGDNRAEYSINRKIYEDLFSLGFEEIKNVLNDKYYFAQLLTEPEYLVYGLIGYLQTAIIDKEEILSIWAFGISFIDWRGEDSGSCIIRLREAIEECAYRNSIPNILEALYGLAPAYIDLGAYTQKEVKTSNEELNWDNGDSSEELIHEVIDRITCYLRDTGHKGIKEGLRYKVIRLYSEGLIPSEYIESLLIHEFNNNSYSIYHNSFIGALISVVEPDFADSAIIEYIKKVLNSEFRYFSQDLPQLVEWRAGTLDDDYAESGMNELIDMHHSWMTAAGHLNTPSIPNVPDYLPYVDFGVCSDLVSSLLQIVFLIIKSDDADAVRTALSGLFALLRVNSKYISFIESKWSQFHYLAKEWMLMIYELLLEYKDGFCDQIKENLIHHCTDPDFNVALYSNLLVENILSDNKTIYVAREQDYFSDIPEHGNKKLFVKLLDHPWIVGEDVVLSQIESLNELFLEDHSDLETKAAEYAESGGIEENNLITINRHKNKYLKVVCESISIAFYRVLYKEWISGRWAGQEEKLARVVLSSSEPVITLMTPSRWPYNEGYLLKDPETFDKKTKEESKIVIKDILLQGIDDSEVVLAGAFADYSSNIEIHGYLISYFDTKYTNAELSFHVYEKNSRLLLQRRLDFEEENNFANLTLHQNGIELFKNSNFICGFSKFILDRFEWRIQNSINGTKVLDRNNQIIGRLEYHYGFRGSIGNRVNANQPLLLRWVVRRRAINEAIRKSKCPYEIKTVIDYYCTSNID